MSLFFRGWSDEDSGISEYRYKVYKMTNNGENKLQENEQPIITHSNISASEAQHSFTLNAPGMYSIIGEVVDGASNVRYTFRN